MMKTECNPKSMIPNVSFTESILVCTFMINATQVVHKMNALNKTNMHNPKRVRCPKDHVRPFTVLETISLDKDMTCVMILMTNINAIADPSRIPAAYTMMAVLTGEVRHV